VSLPDAFFVPAGDGRFAATEHARGPWSAAHQHAGPPSALLARAFEQAVADDPELQISRLTIELMAPVPLATLDVAATVFRAGRKVRRLDATLSADGRAVARASALVVRKAPRDLGPVALDPHEPPPPPEQGTPFKFPVFHASGVGYDTAVDARRVRGGYPKNPTTVWIRSRVALVDGEAPSPLQRVMIAADSGNGVAVVLDPRRYTFMNADLTVYLHRLPEGEWVCLDAVTAVVPGGVGLATSRLFDARGAIGWGLQGLVVEVRDSGCEYGESTEPARER
jgi:hypothetical protein